MSNLSRLENYIFLSEYTRIYFFKNSIEISSSSNFHTIAIPISTTNRSKSSDRHENHRQSKSNTIPPKGNGQVVGRGLRVCQIDRRVT